MPKSERDLHVIRAMCADLQLSLGLFLGFHQDGLHLGSLHNIALDLQLPTHVQLLCICFARDEFRELIIREYEVDWKVAEEYPSAALTSTRGLTWTTYLMAPCLRAQDQFRPCRSLSGQYTNSSVRRLCS